VSDRTNVLTTIIGAVTAVLGLVTAIIVLAATMGTSSQSPATTPPPTATLVAATTSPAPTVTPSNAPPSPSPGPTSAPSLSPAPSMSLIPPPSAPPTAAPTSTPVPSAEPTPEPTAEPTPAPTTEATPRPIVFYSVREDPDTREQNADLYWVDPETSLERRLTTNFEPDSDPAWSPDGTLIAFDSRLDGNTRDIWIMDSGGELLRITEDEEDDAFPGFSPDQTQVAWSRGEGSDREIWVASAQDGSDAHSVTSGADDRAPSWSSRGLIAFMRRADSGSPFEVWVVEPDVSGPVVRIAAVDGGGSYPAWSPDGRRIAFVRMKDGLNRVFTVDADGTSNLVEVTKDVDCDCEFPTWSPDGTQIAYVGPRGTTRGIYVIDADGGTPRRVTANGLVPSWGD
jgi:dipeptidyl aminopeptidase/acylaminoacyl peptidase